MKVKMVPHITQMGGESGIKRVVEAYFKYLPEFGIELVDPKASSYDILAAHAGILGGDCDVAHLHGIYFTADYQASYGEYATNKNVVRSALTAKIVTVPTRWVAKTFQRDMRIQPEVLPHGIEASEWAHDGTYEPYVLWNKNRASDVCDPTPIGRLAQLAPDVLFASTFAPRGIESLNLKIIGTLPHEQMKAVVQKAAVYLSTTKETFGIGVLEALAAGTPVLGWAYGGNLDLVEHGVTGYLAQPNNYEDLLIGLEYCLQYRQQLSDNARIAAKAWTWRAVAEQLAGLYIRAAKEQEVSASIVIPVYNKPVDVVERAIRSALAQDWQNPTKVIIVDDNSDNGEAIAELAHIGNGRAFYHRLPVNSGVANARNYGIAQTSSKYVACLDADDEIEPLFLSRCIAALEADKSVGVAYTRLRQVNSDGSSTISAWPPSEFDYNRQLERFNQIPTCCVFRKDVWEKLGGYRQRYAPFGAGEEDAEFWLRIGALGYKAVMATEEPLFVYHTGSNSVYGNNGHQATDWVAWHPWVKDGRHPFASIAKPTNEQSHPVRQYDQPIVSVIIPVAPWHLPHVVDALDSLEAQTYRLWEVICVIDGLPQDTKLYARLKKAYPYITIIENLSSPKGAGWARNEGAKQAAGKFLVFLDADDYLAPAALDLMLKAWNKHQGIIYTDYVDRAIWDRKAYDELSADRKLFYNERTGEAFIRRYSKLYDWDEAIRQPEYNPNDANAPFYIWCINTVLMPKVWFDELGGYDTSMNTWEDVDLHWRAAIMGKPYFRVEEPLVTYRFYTGSRREAGQVRDQATADDFKKRIAYLKSKYERMTIMPCTGCGGNKSMASAELVQTFRTNLSPNQSGGFGTMSDEEFAVYLYDHPNKGMHPVVGPATRRNYGYHSGGEQFLVHKADAAAMPDVYKLIVEEQAVASVEVEAPMAVSAPPPPPRKPDFANVAGITKETEAKLVAANIFTAGEILLAGKQGLENAGVPARVAGLIYNSAKKNA